MFIVTLWVMSFLKHRMVSYVIFFSFWNSTYNSIKVRPYHQVWRIPHPSTRPIGFGSLS
jgi:hypothetical protein